MGSDRDDDAYGRGDVDWTWARGEIGRHAAGDPPPRFPLPRVERGALTLAAGARTIAFPRPRWHWAAALVGTSVFIVAGLDKMLYRVRARWDDAALVIETWPQRRGKKVARAEVADVHRGRERLEVRLHAGEALPLVIGRKVRRGDDLRARELAHGLGVPFVDERGVVEPLPEARLRPPR